MRYLVMALVSLVGGSTAFAEQKLEEVLVTSIAVSGDRMPTIGPGFDRKDQAEISFRALSSGCTQPSSFKIVVEQTPTQNILSIVRIQQDFCRTVVHPVELKVQTDLISGDKEIILSNPLLVEKHFAF